MGEQRNQGTHRALDALALVLDGQKLTVSGMRQHFGVSEGTARRTFAALQRFPGVRANHDARPAYLAYADPELSSRPALRTSTIISSCIATSLASLFAGLRYASQMRSFRDALVRRAGLVTSTRDLDRKFMFLAGGGEQAVNVSAHIVDDVLEGVLHSRTLRLTYENFDGDRRERMVRPLSLVVYQHQLYLIALRENSEYCTLRVSRILEVELSDDPFSYPPRVRYDPTQLFEHSFGIFLNAGEPQLIHVRLAPRWRTYAKHHRWHSHQKVSVRRDGRVDLKIKARICPEVYHWLLGFGAEAEVIAPKVLRVAIAEKVHAMHQLYSKNNARQTGR